MNDVSYKSISEINSELPLVLIDFDHTIVDTDKMRLWMFDRIDKLGFTKEDIAKTYENAKNVDGSYSLEIHLKLLCDITHKNLDEASKKVFMELCPVQDTVYTDARKFIMNKSSDYNLLIFTLAEQKTQEARIDCSRLMNFIRGIVFTQIKKSQVLNKGIHKINDNIIFDVFPNLEFKKIILIDDHPREFEDLDPKLLSILDLFRLRREGDKYSTLETPQGIKEITSFNDLNL